MNSERADRPEGDTTALPETFVPTTGINAAQAAAELGNEGSSAFHQGVLELAAGITRLSRADQTHVPEMHSEAIQYLGSGNQNVEAGRVAVDQANEIISAENRIASVGVDTGLETHELTFDARNLTEEGRSTLEQMETQAGVPVSSLVSAVNNGGRIDSFVELATSAKGVTTTKEQILSEMSDLPPPVPSKLFALLAQFGKAPGTLFGNKLQDPAKLPADAKIIPLKFEDHRRPALAALAAANGAKGNSLRNGPPEWVKAGGKLQPLGSEQFFGSIGAAQASRDEFGDASETLFTRVRRQHAKRQDELRSKSVGAH
jgi:hypothetical protein